MSRFLITTADEDIRRFDRPGPVSRRNVPRVPAKRPPRAAIDAVVATSCGSLTDQKEQDSLAGQSVVDYLPSDLPAAPSALHREKCSVWHWRNVFAHWRQRYLAVIFNRNSWLEQPTTMAVDMHSSNGCKAYSDQSEACPCTNHAPHSQIPTLQNHKVRILYAPALSSSAY